MYYTDANELCFLLS